MIIGVTGSMATGVSTASACIAKALKAEILCADAIAHAQLQKNKTLAQRLIEYFGNDIVLSNRIIDRKRLSELAFSNKANYKKLCETSYPVIIKSIENRIKSLSRKGARHILIDAPMLIESGFYKSCDYIILVMASLPLQLERCRDKNIIKEDVLKRIKMQMPLRKKEKYADYIISNSGDLEKLRFHCKEISQILKGKLK
jgi:dephospho-CoA kinase